MTPTNFILKMDLLQHQDHVVFNVK